MHLKSCYFVLYTPIYRLTGEKTFPCTKLSMRNGAKIGYALGLLVHGKVVFEFGRKVFLVDSLL